jgi:hypothetical protein
MSRDEHSRAADPTCSLSGYWLALRSLSHLPSTSHRTLPLCCPCRADPTQPSDTFHVTACTRILPTHTAGRQRDPEPSHQRACSSFYTDAPPFCVEVSSSPTFPLVRSSFSPRYLLRALRTCAFCCCNFDKIRLPRIHTHSRVSQSRAARRQIPDALACCNLDRYHAGSTSSACKLAKQPQRINWRLLRIRLARLPQPLGTASSGRFVLFLPLSSK